jgi:transposase
MKFLRTLRHWIAQHGKVNVVYFDESGFASHAHRPHGWAIRGKEVFGRIRGNNRKRTNLIMAQRGSDWLAPMLFEASCTHLTVTTWVKKMLLPTLRPNSLVIMDNAPFHNKPKISKLLAEDGHVLLPLPRYSPDFNPIEQAFAILKRQRQFTGRGLEDLISSHS